MKSNVLGRDEREREIARESERERKSERGKERREKKRGERKRECVCGAGRRGKTKFGK